MAKTDFRTAFRQYGPIILFVTMTMMGSAIIWGGKLYDFDIALVTAVPVVLMLLYLALNLFPGLRVRSEQAGDNLYYMGFIFTLASLGISLYRFTGEASIEDVVRNFGIAILSTITGIALRIFYNQMRRDPADIDAAVRLELSEMTRRVRTELDSSALEFSSYRRTSNQMLAEGFEEIARQAEKNGEAVRVAIEAMSSNANKAIEDASRNLLANLEATHKHVADLAEKNISVVSTIATRMDTSVSNIINRADALCVAMEEMTRKFTDARSPDEILRIDVAPAVDALKQIVESSVASIDSNAATTRDTAKKVLAAIAPFKAVATELKQLSAEIKASTAASAASLEGIGDAVKSIHRASDVVEEFANLEHNSNEKLERVSVAVDALAGVVAKRGHEIASRADRIESMLANAHQNNREVPIVIDAALGTSLTEQGGMSVTELRSSDVLNSNGPETGRSEKSRWNLWK